MSSRFYESFKLACLILKNCSIIFSVTEGLEAMILFLILLSKIKAKSHVVISSDMDWARVKSQDRHIDWHNGKTVDIQFEDVRVLP